VRIKGLTNQLVNGVVSLVGGVCVLRVISSDRIRRCKSVKRCDYRLHVARISGQRGLVIDIQLRATAPAPAAAASDAGYILRGLRAPLGISRNRRVPGGPRV